MWLRAVVRSSKGRDKLVGATWSNRNFPDLLMELRNVKLEVGEASFPSPYYLVTYSSCFENAVERDPRGYRELKP